MNQAPAVYRSAAHHKTTYVIARRPNAYTLPAFRMQPGVIFSMPYDHADAGQAQRIARRLSMSDSARFALHRPELLETLERGEEKILRQLPVSAVTIRAGQTLIRARHDHEYVYRLRQGWAGRSRQLADGRNQFILIFLPGDLFAVKSMFMSQHPDDVRALTDLHVERISARALLTAFRKDGDVASRCIWQVMEEERRLHSWVVGLGQGSAAERLARLLIDFRGRLRLSGSIVPRALTYPMPLTQSQLADHLGITAVHVSRVLKSFRERGIAILHEGRASISNLKALAQIAQPLLDPYEANHPAYVGAPER